MVTSAATNGTVGALLAGGDSSRMGSDKRLLELGDRPLFRWATEALSWTTERVQAGGSALPGLGWPVLRDDRADAGPAGAIETLLTRYADRPLVVCAVDLPFAGRALLERTLEMAAACRQSGATVAAVVPRHGGRWHPLSATWLPAALAPLTTRLDAGRRDLHGLLDELSVVALEGAALARIGPPDRLLTNVNTPDQLADARAWLEAS